MLVASEAFFKEPHMHLDLRNFLVRLAGVVVISVVPVIVTAFLTMPLSLGRHPGEAPALDEGQPRHMT
jgi:hypothetical protein